MYNVICMFNDSSSIFLQASFVVNAYVHGVRSKILQEAINLKIRRKLTARRMSNIGLNSVNTQHRWSVAQNSLLQRPQSEAKLNTTKCISRFADDNDNQQSIVNGFSGKEPDTKRRPSLFRNHTVASDNFDEAGENIELNHMDSPTPENDPRLSFLLTEKHILETNDYTTCLENVSV